MRISLGTVFEINSSIVWTMPHSHQDQYHEDRGTDSTRIRGTEEQKTDRYIHVHIGNNIRIITTSASVSMHVISRCTVQVQVRRAFIVKHPKHNNKQIAGCCTGTTC